MSTKYIKLTYELLAQMLDLRPSCKITYLQANPKTNTFNIFINDGEESIEGWELPQVSLEDLR